MVAACHAAAQMPPKGTVSVLLEGLLRVEMKLLTYKSARSPRVPNQRHFFKVPKASMGIL